MRIVIIGPGALGLFIAARISQTLSPISKNHPDRLLLLDHCPKRIRQLNQQGITLEEKNGHRQQLQIFTTNQATQLRNNDLILLCTKSHDLQQSLRKIRPYINQETLIIGFQNGLEHLSILKKYPATTAIAITSEGAARLSSTHVRHGGYGQTGIGFLHPSPSHEAQQRLQQLQQKLNQARVHCHLLQQPEQQCWEKLFANVAINALSALHDLPNGKLLTAPFLRRQMRSAVKEAVAVALALKITVPTAPLRQVFKVCRATATNSSSMRQDIQQGRTTEITAINGAIVKLGKKLQVDTPTNTALMQQIQQLSISSTPYPKPQASRRTHKKVTPTRLGFDFDGVIADIGTTFLTLLAKRYNHNTVTLSDLTSFQVEKCLPLPVEKIDAIFQEILEDPVGCGLPPMADAITVLTRLSQDGIINVITARPTAQPVYHWLEMMAPKLADKINVVAMGSHQGKPEHIHRLQLSHFIDDRAETCLQLAEENLCPIVYDQPWNRNRHNLLIVRSWQDINTLCYD